MQDRAVRRLIVRRLLISSFVALAVLAGGCKKKVGNLPPTAPPPPVAAEPTVTINASTTSINAGDSVTLNWTSTNASDLNLSPGIGKVPPEGSQTVTPTESTTYQITATGPGGSAQASVRVTVTAANNSESVGPTPNAGLDQLFAANVKDAFYDFNKSDLRPDARQALTQTAEFLRNYPQMHVSIEGHCDERGSTEYNLGLGERRAQAARDFLVQLGISADRLTTVSYGKEKPFCTQSNEECWQQNRRAHFVRAQ